MHRVRLSIALASIGISPAVMAATDDVQAWGALNLSADLSKHVVANLEVQRRWVDDVSRASVVLVRPTVGYKVSKDVTLHIGYTRRVTANPGRPTLRENWYFQQVNWRIGELGDATVHSRTRFELRTAEGRSESGLRARERLQFSIPTKTKGLNLVLSSEWFFGLKAIPWGQVAGFDQVRNFGGVSIPLSKAVTVEAGYMHRYQRRNGAPDRSDHIIPVMLTVKL